MISSIKMLSSDVTYYCEYGRCFLIGYHVFKLEHVLLLAQLAKENIWSLKYCWQAKQKLIIACDSVKRDLTVASATAALIRKN